MASWAEGEIVCLLASADFCISTTQSFDGIANLMRSQSYNRTFSQCSSKLTKLGAKHATNCLKPRLKDLRERGFRCLALPEGLRARVDEFRSAFTGVSATNFDVLTRQTHTAAQEPTANAPNTLRINYRKRPYEEITDKEDSIPYSKKSRIARKLTQKAQSSVSEPDIAAIRNVFDNEQPVAASQAGPHISNPSSGITESHVTNSSTTTEQLKANGGPGKPPTNSSAEHDLHNEIDKLSQQLANTQAKLAEVERRNVVLEEIFAKSDCGRNIDGRRLLNDLEKEKAETADMFVRLQESHQVEIQALKHAYDLKTEYWKKESDFQQRANRVLHEDLQSLRDPLNLGRRKAWPPRAHHLEVVAEWTLHPDHLRLVFALNYDLIEDENSSERIIEQFGPLLRRICALPATQRDAEAKKEPKLSEYFKNIHSPPQVSQIAISLWHAQILEWVFNTSFHFTGHDSDKLPYLWKALASYSGLAVTREYDRIAINARTKEPYFQNYEIPKMAEKQAEIHESLFKGLIDIKEDVVCKSHVDPREILNRNGLRDKFEALIRLKAELITNSEGLKLVYFPPGAAFDARRMEAVDEAGFVIELKDPADYRVKLCMWPALITDSEAQSELPDEFGNGDRYREALLEERSFFLEDPERYAEWQCPERAPYYKGWVLVEKVVAPQESEKSEKSKRVPTSDDDNASIPAGSSVRRHPGGRSSLNAQARASTVASSSIHDQVGAPDTYSRKVSLQGSPHIRVRKRSRSAAGHPEELRSPVKIARTDGAQDVSSNPSGNTTISDRASSSDAGREPNGTEDSLYRDP